MGFDLSTGRIRDSHPGTARHISRIEDRIVMNHHHPVRGPVNVQLDRPGAQLDGPLEGGNRVFGQAIMRPAMRDGDRVAGKTRADGLIQGFLGRIGAEKAEPMNCGGWGQSALTPLGSARLPNEAE